MKEQMRFKDLFPTFIAGTPIKRKVWKGYWVYKHGRIEIHTKEGEIVNFLEVKDIIFTISGILEDDWEIATPENTKIAGIVRDDSLENLRKGGIISDQFFKAVAVGVVTPNA